MRKNPTHHQPYHPFNGFKYFAPFILVIALTGCAALNQIMCAPHNKSIEKPFPEGELKECIATNTYWASHPVFCIGIDRTKPPVILLHELPGLSPKTLHYAQTLSEDFSVYVPLLYGSPNQSSALKGAFAFHLNGEWSARPELDNNPRIVKWLQHVTTQVQHNHPGQTIGVIGNCMTGAIPLALLDNPAVTAAVLAQPTLPLPFLYYSHEDTYSLGISEHALKIAIARADVRIYFVRFETDCVSKPEKKTTLTVHFGSRFIDGEIHSSEYTDPQQSQCRKVHSTLIAEWCTPGLIGKASRDRREEVRKFLLNPIRYTPPPHM
ncbi:MAG: hypothetical protein HOP32_05865 [Nitrospira sp.]|nr:hypothetical protein [Nitrospira sp.]